MRKTVLVIGAGASADFGLPLWGQLKEQLNELDVNNFLEEIPDLSEHEKMAHKSAFDEYLKWMQSEPDYTLDRIIYEIDKPKHKHMNPTGYLVINIVGYLLAQFESQISDGRWITQFQDHLVDLVAQASRSPRHSSTVNLLENLAVVSLNYDRVFEYFMTLDFFKKLIDHGEYQPTDFIQSKLLAIKTELRIYRPHGYIGLLPNASANRSVGMGSHLGVTGGDDRGVRHPGNNTPAPFGDPNLLNKEYFLRMGKYMYVVNERAETDYVNANGALNSAEDVFCLGLSPDGICQSSLEFKSGQKVYLSNYRNDLEDVSTRKPGPDYKTLSNDGSQLAANDFTKKFIEISSGSS